MILLSGHSLTPARKIPVESMSLQLNERESSATVSPADMTGISTGGWVKSENGPAAGIVWRVKSIEQNYAQNTPRIQLEHAVSILKDRILFGEVTAAKITGNPNATECSAEAAVRYILGKQSDWERSDTELSKTRTSSTGTRSWTRWRRSATRWRIPGGATTSAVIPSS